MKTVGEEIRNKLWAGSHADYLYHKTYQIAEKANSKVDSNRDRFVGMSFSRRHAALITLAVVGFIAMVSLALVVTGVFSGVGIVLAAGLATYLGMAGVMAAGGLAAGAAAGVVVSEKALSQYQRGLAKVKSDAHQEINDDVDGIPLFEPGDDSSSDSDETELDIEDAEIETALSAGERSVAKGLNTRPRLPTHLPDMVKSVDKPASVQNDLSTAVGETPVLIH